MTNEELSKLGVHKVDTKLEKHLYYIEAIDCERQFFTVPDIQMIHSEILREGKRLGRIEGKNQLREDFKKLMNDD